MNNIFKLGNKVYLKSDLDKTEHTIVKIVPKKGGIYCELVKYRDYKGERITVYKNEIKLIDKKGRCRICDGIAVKSKGYVNIHNIGILIENGNEYEFETKLINCNKCSNCGHSWI